MPLVDSHAHLDFYTEKPGEIEAVLSRARAAGVETILAIGIGEGPPTMHQASKSPRPPNVYASVGIHPQEAHQASEENLAKLSALAAIPAASPSAKSASTTTTSTIPCLPSSMKPSSPR